jgi:protein-S-isoprenylcysteine O-methyltransferase Ste14
MLPMPRTLAWSRAGDVNGMTSPTPCEDGRMAAVALIMCSLYVVVMFGVRAIVQRRRTGSSGWVGAATNAEHRANMLVLAAWLLDLLAATLVLSDATRPTPTFDGPVAHAAGVAALVLSLALGVVAQEAMGPAWRTGIDPDHPSQLATTGVLAVVRNPVYTSMIGTSLGVALLVPSVVSALALAACVTGLEIQTRAVEEPHLRMLHGDAYERYSAHTGRFVPRLGRRRDRAQN